jgi:SAM-dependent methyltransferase
MPLPHYLTDAFLLEAVSRRDSRVVSLPRDRLLCRVLGRYGLYIDAGTGASVRLALDGFRDLAVTVALARALAPRAHCVTVDGGDGYLSLLAADAAGPDGRVLVAAPDSRAVDLIQASLRENRIHATVEVVDLSGNGRPDLADLVSDWPRVQIVAIDRPGAAADAWPAISRIAERTDDLRVFVGDAAAADGGAGGAFSAAEDAGFSIAAIEPDGSSRRVSALPPGDDRPLLLRRRRRPRVRGHTGEPAIGLPYSKLCNLEDFTAPDLSAAIHEVFAREVDELGSDFPVGREHRKIWEIAMAARTLENFGALREDAEILGVGAGTETTIFWLTKRVRRVFATDLYLAAGSWEDVATRSMLIEPERHAPEDWEPRRLVAQHMDALDLRYEDESFEGVFSSSSIEHFGSIDDVERAIDEIFRVLKPGGVATLSTEFRLEGPPPGLPGTLFFDEEQLLERVVGDRAWALPSPLDLDVSAATAATEVEFDDAVAGTAQLPHIILRQGPYAWTSVHLALVKAR